MFPVDLYVIEESNPDHYGACRYRFVSLYNGARGVWYYKKEQAEMEGNRHGNIILYLHEKGGVE